MRRFRLVNLVLAGLIALSALVVMPAGTAAAYEEDESRALCANLANMTIVEWFMLDQEGLTCTASEVAAALTAWGFEVMVLDEASIMVLLPVQMEGMGPFGLNVMQQLGVNPAELGLIPCGYDSVVDIGPWGGYAQLSDCDARNLAILTQLRMPQVMQYQTIMGLLHQHAGLPAAFLPIGARVNFLELASMYPMCAGQGMTLEFFPDQLHAAISCGA